MSENRPRADALPGVVLRYLWPVGFLAAAAVVLWIITLAVVHAVTVHTSELFKPNISVTTILHSTINDVRKEAKLVVASAELTPEVTKSESYWIWWFYFGTTTARVKAPGSRVQYIIPLDNFSESNIEQIPSKKLVRVHFPAPRLDEEMVAVNLQHLEEWKASAWARFNKEEVAAEARGMLREATLEVGKKEWVQTQVRADARKTLEHLLAPLKGALKEGVRMEVMLEEK